MSRSQRPFKPDEHELKALKDLYKKLGKPLPDNLKDKTSSKVNRSKLARNPSFDINETPATRRTRKIRTLQERGVGGEKGNAGDILNKGIQLPPIQAKKKTKKRYA